MWNFGHLFKSTCPKLSNIQFLLFFNLIFLISAIYDVFCFLSYTERVSYVIKLLMEKHKDEVKQIKFKDEKEPLIYFQDVEVRRGCQEPRRRN